MIDGMKSYQHYLKSSSRQLRKNMTDAEQMIWYRVRRKQIMGVQFYRQKPLLNYIVDFYCAKAHLIIELDGSQHFEDEYQQSDSVRDKALMDIGLLVLRFDNHQVLTEIDSVIRHIYHVVEQRLSNPPLTPLRLKRLLLLIKGGIRPKFVINFIL